MIRFGWEFSLDRDRVRERWRKIRVLCVKHVGTYDLKLILRPGNPWLAFKVSPIHLRLLGWEKNLKIIKWKRAILNDLIIAVARVWTWIAARTAVTDRTRFGTVDWLRFAAGHVARSRWFRNTARISATRRTRSFWALCGALWWTGVASWARTILTASATRSATRPADKATEKNRLVYSSIKAKVRRSLSRRLKNFHRRVEIPNRFARVGCDDLERRSWSPWWHFTLSFGSWWDVLKTFFAKCFLFLVGWNKID